LRPGAGNPARENGRRLIGHNKIKPEIGKMDKRGFAAQALKLQLALCLLKIFNHGSRQQRGTADYRGHLHPQSRGFA